MEAMLKQQCAYCGADSIGSKYCCLGCQCLAGEFAIVDSAPSIHSYLDLPNFKNRYKLSRGLFNYRLYVEGLHCASCIHLLEKLPEFNVGVLQANVDFSKSCLSIRVEIDFSLARLVDLLQSWGYAAHFLTVDEGIQERIQKENRSLLKKLAVTGACAGNIMLFVIPVYSGLEGSLKIAFNWMSFLIFLPVVFYSGTQFYQGAWNSLRYRQVNVDLPITLALLSGFLLSTINLIRGDGGIYFDSTAGFIFLILCARYYLKQSQQRFLNAQPLGNEIEKDQYRLIENEFETIVFAKDIRFGDLIRLKRGQTCPIDGILKSSALIDLAVMNGEPLPRRFESGMKILAGSKILSDQIEVKVQAPYDSTYLSSLLEELRSGETVKSAFISLTDKWAQWLILGVSLTAIIYFILNYQSNFQEAYNRALALIVLACPCALAFGAPLTMNLAIRKAQKLGLLIKDSNTLEKLWNIRSVVFDKTGTLTSLQLKVVKTEPAELNSNLKSIILGLERSSSHPIAFALREFWKDEKAVAIDQLDEKIGSGVRGRFQGFEYEISRETDDSDLTRTAVAVLRNSKKICTIYLESPLDLQAKEVVQMLHSQGIQTYLSSGDLVAKALAIGKKCGISSDQIFGEQSPQAKRNLILSLKNACMIGDGSNDALALQAADVGIAVKGSTYLNLGAADVYFTREGLRPLFDLLNLAKKAKQVLIRNMTFALIYNLVGGILALLGFVDPWLAAVLMPASSFLIISSTLWGFR